MSARVNLRQHVRIIGEFRVGTSRRPVRATQLIVPEEQLCASYLRTIHQPDSASTRKGKLSSIR
jgi:hypothetical protein